MSRNYRAKWHNYRAAASYHITLFKNPGVPPFSKVEGELRGRSNTFSPTPTYSSTGRAISAALPSLHELEPAILLQQYIIMPDHIHLLISVCRNIESPLGDHLAALKVLANGFAGGQLFEHGFHDRIIRPDMLSVEEERAQSLMSEYEKEQDKIRRLNECRNIVKKYIKENPRRLLIRRQYPRFFSRVEELYIAGHQYQAYGNLLLLQNPFKKPVVVHTSDDDDTRKDHRDKWLHTAANGGVLVSPFISPDEKQIRREAEALDGKLILLRNEPFEEREKPMGHDFELCEQGRMLILHPLALPKSDPNSDKCSRKQCVYMNARAAEIAKEHAITLSRS